MENIYSVQPIESDMNNFDVAFNNNNLENMEKYFVNSPKNNFYIDISLEDGNTDIVNFFLNKGVKPSLFANQIAKINGYNDLANKIESYYGYRNMVNIKNVYYTFDRTDKKMIWNPIIPQEFRF